MVWPGALLIVIGAVLTFAFDDVARMVGIVAVVLGAALVVVGALRSARSRDDARTSKIKVAAMVVAVVYILSPVDIVPDFLLPAGVVDDATALAWLLFAVGQEVSRRRRRAL
jgi:drug/metabolite transporter (DMT)-like permease